jgi:Sulfotransferase domain
MTKEQVALQKVFCVGFQKTGTTSLGRALEVLGYTVCGYQQFRDLAHVPTAHVGQLVRERALTLLRDYSAFADTPWPVLYDACDRASPGSRFIHVIRDEDRWIQSVVDDFGEFDNSVHEWIYGHGHPKGNESAYIERYREHNQKVAHYFRGKSRQYVLLNLDRGQVNWDGVCSFLDIDTPKVPWPHLNSQVSKSRKMLVQRLKSRVRALF